MQLTDTIAKSNFLDMKKEVLRVVLDEPRIYLEESLGSVMIRGEVIVNFSKDTYIEGPIEVIFEGIQRFYPWPAIMKGSPLGSPIDTKLQVIELSLLPPNSQGLMPSGIQRFPFEFPIPSTLPTTVFIENRMEIFYQTRAIIRRSVNVQENNNKKPIGWLEWARQNTQKKKYVACSPMRVVRAMASIVSDGLNVNNELQPTGIEQHEQQVENNTDLILQVASSQQQNSSSTSINNRITATTTQLPWNRRGLDEYQSTFDEQHDLLAFSLAGRSSGNLTQSIEDLCNVQGIRYKIGIDRTAIALGTSIGVDIMIEPTYDNAIVKSVIFNVIESRKYSMKVPAGHTSGITKPETKKFNEGVKMVLKWAFGYQLDDEEEESLVYNIKSKKSNGKKGERYVRQRTENSQYLAYFDPPQPGLPSSKSFLNSTFENNMKKTKLIKHMYEREDDSTNSTSSQPLEAREVVNLKELNQPIRLGEYFGGRFVMPFPDCDGIVHPSMDSESVKITHWFQLVVTVECDGKVFDLLLDTPGRILDCRLVHDDECETLLPPPPSYQFGDGQNQNTWTQSTFWEQREPITLVSGWGTCKPCPCEAKKLKAKMKKDTNKKANNNAIQDSRNTTENPNDTCSPSLLPEWGPPPCYTEN